MCIIKVENHHKWVILENLMMVCAFFYCMLKVILYNESQGKMLLFKLIVCCFLNV